MAILETAVLPLNDRPRWIDFTLISILPHTIVAAIFPGAIISHMSWFGEHSKQSRGTRVDVDGQSVGAPTNRPDNLNRLSRVSFLTYVEVLKRQMVKNVAEISPADLYRKNIALGVVKHRVEMRAKELGIKIEL